MVDQTKRRVFDEMVPAGEKVVRLFERNTDIRRQRRACDRVRAQDQPEQRAQWAGARRGGRGWQPGGQYALTADAEAARGKSTPKPP